ncbi:MAG: fibronectin type III domain-containing protein [Candidatus Caldarchaeum sp.]
MRKTVAVFLLFLIGLSSFMMGQFTNSFTKTVYSTVTETVTSLSRFTTTIREYISNIITTTKVVTTTVTLKTTLTGPPPTIGLPPAPPSNMRVQDADFGRIVLTWQDNSVDEDGFLIERSEDNKIFTSIGRTASNTVSFADTSVERERTYFYRVRAYRGSFVSNPSNTVVETATPYGIQLTNYFGGLGEVETGYSNLQEREGFADIFIPFWNWQPWPTGSRGATAEASIDFSDFISGAGSQRITIRRDNESGEDTRLILLPLETRAKNPAYAAFYPLPGDKLLFAFHYKTSEQVRNIEYAVMLDFNIRDSTGNERYLQSYTVLKASNATPFWRKVSFTVGVPANSTAVRFWVTFTCRKSCSGTFWFDNFILHTEPVKRLPLIGRNENNFKLAFLYVLWQKDPLELAQKYDLLLGGLDSTLVKGINSKVLSLVYFNDPSLTVSRRNDSNRPPCMLRWDGRTPVYEFLRYRDVYDRVLDEWLLSSSSSSRYPRVDGSGYYIVREIYCEFLVDIGRQDVVETALRNIEKIHLLAGFRNPSLSAILFHDNFPIFIYLWAMDGEPPSKYPDRETRKKVLENMLDRLKREVLDPYPDRRIIANIGVFTSESFQLLLQFDYDGVLIEYFTRIFSRTFHPSHLYQQFQALKNYPEEKMVVLVDVVPGQYVELWNENPRLVPEDVRRNFNFVVAALYLVNKPNTYILLRGGEWDYDSIYILKDFYIPLGRPEKGFETVEGDENGALLLRRYSNGLVLLNTATDRNFTYNLEGRYRDRAGNIFTGLITIPPQTGLTLYKS